MFTITLFWFKCCIPYSVWWSFQNNIFLVFFFMTLNLANQQKHPAIALMLHSGTVRCLNAQDWFRHFRNGNFNLEDSPRSGRPAQVDNDRLRQLIRGRFLANYA